MVFFATNKNKKLALLLLESNKPYNEFMFFFEFDYILYCTFLEYSLDSSKKTLNCKTKGHRELIANEDGVAYVHISLGRDRKTLPLKYDTPPHITYYKRDNEGTVKCSEPHKCSDTGLTTRINFDPPLKKGEKVTFVYESKIQGFKFSNIEDLRESMKDSIIDARDYEYNSLKFLYRIHNFEYNITMSPDCKTIPAGGKIVYGVNGIEVPSEDYCKIDRKDNCVISYNGAGWHMKFTISKPVLYSKFIFKWKLPKQQEI